MEKKSFLFYLNWKDQIDELDDQELRRLINNLIKYHSGEEVDLQTKTDRLVWRGILPGLEVNKDKYEKRVQANRENSKLGGAPKGNQNASKDKTTQINPEQPKQPDKREQINDNSKIEIENRKEVNDNREQTNDNNKKETGIEKTKAPVPYYSGSSSTISKTSSGISLHEFYKQRGLYG
jgi:hypothetical protein